MNTVLYILLQIAAAFFSWIVIQTTLEWVVHKYILHGLGKNKNSFFHYHWEHHYRCRKNNNMDPEYRDFLLGRGMSKMVKKEVGMLCAITLTLLIGIFVSVYVAQSVFLFALHVFGIIGTWLYFDMHAWSHAFAITTKESNFREHYDLPQHWMHHMSNQNSWWVVTFPTYHLTKLVKAAKNRLTSK